MFDISVNYVGNGVALAIVLSVYVICLCFSVFSSFFIDKVTFLWSTVLSVQLSCCNMVVDGP